MKSQKTQLQIEINSILENYAESDSDMVVFLIAEDWKNTLNDSYIAKYHFHLPQDFPKLQSLVNRQHYKTLGRIYYDYHGEMILLLDIDQKIPSHLQQKISFMENEVTYNRKLYGGNFLSFKANSTQEYLVYLISECSQIDNLVEMTISNTKISKKMKFK